MKIALSTDHAGYELLKELQWYLEATGHECVNYGPKEYSPEDDYPDFIRPAAEAVASGSCDFGIIFGGSGQGEAIVANKVSGIRCGVFYGKASPQGTEGDDGYEILRLNRQHNNANILSLAGRFLNFNEVKEAVDIWLNTPFSNEERHVRRIAKIDE